MIDYKKIISSKNLDDEFAIISEQIQKLKTPEGFLQFVLYSISELFANIKEHSKAERVSIEIKVDNRDVFLVKVSDDGVGLRKSYLSKGIFPKDDSSAIEFALSGLSTKDPKERGYGLYTIREFIETLGGTMELRSGESLAIIEKNKIQFRKTLGKTKGVDVLLKAKIRKVNFYKIVK